MSSLYLNRLSREQYNALQTKLHGMQKGVCFICGKDIDLALHEGAIDIDHIVPTKLGGKDDPVNFALTHSSCNRAKQDSNLEVARVLHQFEEIRDALAVENRGPNLNDVLAAKGGARYGIKFVRNGNKLRYCFSALGDDQIREVQVYVDGLSRFEYFFAELPIEYIYHDDKINPRSIGQNISKLVKEFYLKRPQLHIGLGWIELKDGQSTEVKIFDGQHKAAAQILLGVTALPVRVFINPDPDVLLTTNTNAGTTLRQVAFDKSVQRHLGSALYLDRIRRFQRETKRPEDDFTLSERDLLKYFRGESREIKRYILDAVRDGITHHPDNKLKEYVDFGGRGTERPLSYSTIEKTFYSFFIYQDVLDTPLDFRMEEGENPRELEKSQILRVMNVIAEEIYIGKFDPDIGTRRIENRVQKGEFLPLEHLKAFRVSKEEVLYNWLHYIAHIIKNYFIMQGKPIDDKKLFQYLFPEPIWDRIRLFVRNLANLSVWVNNELSATVLGGKQNYDFWQTIFETGHSPQGLQVLAKPLDLMEMIKE
ncbi:MAG: HNH endonuclease [Anaerolineae bacterium]|nr:HNH endonuclease [Anaerolineae bacterium]